MYIYNINIIYINIIIGSIHIAHYYILVHIPAVYLLYATDTRKTMRAERKLIINVKFSRCT